MVLPEWEDIRAQDRVRPEIMVLQVPVLIPVQVRGLPEAMALQVPEAIRGRDLPADIPVVKEEFPGFTAALPAEITEAACSPETVEAEPR